MRQVLFLSVIMALVLGVFIESASAEMLVDLDGCDMIDRTMKEDTLLCSVGDDERRRVLTIAQPDSNANEKVIGVATPTAVIIFDTTGESYTCSSAEKKAGCQIRYLDDGTAYCYCPKTKVKTK